MSSDYYGTPQPPAYTPPGQQPYYPGGHPQDQQAYSGFPPGSAPQPGVYGGHPPQDTKSPAGTPYYDPYAQQPGAPQQQYYGSPPPQQQYGTYPAHSAGEPYSTSSYQSPAQGGYYSPQQHGGQVGDYYGATPPTDGSRSVSTAPAEQSSYGYSGTPTGYQQSYHQQATGGYVDPYAAHGPGAYADGSQPGYGAPGGAANGERGLGSTVIGGAAGAFLGKKVGLGAVGGALAGAVGANLLSHKKKKKKH